MSHSTTAPVPLPPRNKHGKDNTQWPALPARRGHAEESPAASAAVAAEPKAVPVSSSSSAAIAPFATARRKISQVREQPFQAIKETITPLIQQADKALGDDTPEARARSLDRIRYISKLMDAQYKIPIVRIRVGLDPAISAIPYVGDVVSTVLSMYILYLTRRFHVPWSVSLRMAWNVLLNATFGAVPIVGSLFDIAYKPNMKNLHLLEAHLKQQAVRAGRDPKEVDAAIRQSRKDMGIESDLDESDIEEEPSATSSAKKSSKSPAAKKKGWFW